ncbi:MAG: hypothetical protein AAB673_01000, partial [Patescibacteria group bacterium]
MTGRVQVPENSTKGSLKVLFNPVALLRIKLRRARRPKMETKDALCEALKTAFDEIKKHGELHT